MFAQLDTSTIKTKISVEIAMILLFKLFVTNAQLRTSVLSAIKDSTWALRAVRVKEFAKAATIKIVLCVIKNQGTASSVSQASS